MPAVLSGVFCLERRLALDMANLVDAQVEMVGDLPGQTVWIPPIENRLLDDRPFLRCQFLDHALKLGTGGVQEKEKGMGLYVWGGFQTHHPGETRVAISATIAQ
ncbi:MAG TPA: hypothetical protein EYQ31_16165 [Candidatus Handelsmanbacteria bacterium]|nr:hypothetical protein [Candidatus Handelsmanbacteria bacterium]